MSIIMKSANKALRTECEQLIQAYQKKNGDGQAMWETTEQQMDKNGHAVEIKNARTW